MKFTPTEDFWCEELKSQYVKGLVYTVRHPSSRLAKFSKDWLKDGKIREVTGPSARVSGSDKPKSFFERLFSWL